MTTPWGKASVGTNSSDPWGKTSNKPSSWPSGMPDPRPNTKPPVTPPVTPPPVTPPEPTQDQRNAEVMLTNMLKQYGLDALSGDIMGFIQQGYSNDNIMVKLQDTDAYKTRFAGNADRIKNGLNALNPADYISLENSYRQVLESNGLPKGFYDQHSDFQSWIGGDVSPNEINTRAQMASDAVNNSDPTYLQALRQMGLSDGDLVASMLDRTRALPVLQKVVNASKIGAAALKQGLNFDPTKASKFADMGVTAQQANNAYQTIGEALPAAQRLSTIYGDGVNQSDLEDEMLGSSGPASAKRKALAQQEAASFNGARAATPQSLGTGTRGSF